MSVRGSFVSFGVGVQRFGSFVKEWRRRRMRRRVWRRVKKSLTVKSFV